MTERTQAILRRVKWELALYGPVMAVGVLLALAWLLATGG